jgi:hypothetical protein
MYIFLIILWMILSAIINPNHNLVFASAAITFITVMFEKIIFATIEYAKSQTMIV